MPDRLQLLGRRGCHLCEQARDAVLPAAGELGLGVSEYDVDDDPGLRAEFGERVPVLRRGDRVLLEGRIEPGAVRAALHRLLPSPDADDSVTEFDLR
ncbi:MAG: glutaredoxin family protein [Candidatus Dormibacteria bacterium]